MQNSLPEKDNNDITIDTYRDRFDVYEANTHREVSGEVQEWVDAFLRSLPAHASIFEFGSATGRDARYFNSKGYTVLCTDVIPNALERLQAENFQTDYFDFRDEPKVEWLGLFDGVYANGVFVHATRDQFKKNLNTILGILKPHGVAAISLKTGKGEEMSTEKVDAPRYFRYYSEEEVRMILNEFPFEIIEATYSHNGKWLRLVLKKTI